MNMLVFKILIKLISSFLFVNRSLAISIIEFLTAKLNAVFLT